MQDSKQKHGKMEYFCWMIIQFTYSSVATICTTYTPVGDDDNDKTIIIDFRDGAYYIVIVAIAVVTVATIILCYIQDARLIEMSYGPAFFLVGFTVVFMLLAPLAWQFLDGEIIPPIVIAAIGVMIVEIVRTRFGRPLDLKTK